MNKILKYSTILLLFMTSGLLFILIGFIENPEYRYKLYDLFQLGTSHLFDIVDWKFNTYKDNTILVSNYNIAPIVNLTSSILWTGLISVIILLVTRKIKDIDFRMKGFWFKVTLINLILSVFLFLFWLIFMDLDFIYNDVYIGLKSISNSIYDWFMTILYIPSFIPGLIGSITLDSGGDTLHGYGDMYLFSKTMSSFSVTIWSIIGVLIYDKIINLRKKKAY